MELQTSSDPHRPGREREREREREKERGGKRGRDGGKKKQNRGQRNTALADNDTITLMEPANEGEPRHPALLPEGTISSLHS